MSVGALPPLAPGAIPADVRRDGPEAVDRFRSALGFERMLIGQLLESAVPEPGTDGAPQVATLSDTLADALVAGGGIGLAAEIARTTEPGR